MKAILFSTIILFLLQVTSAFSQDSTLAINSKLHLDHISYFNIQENKVNSRNEGLLNIALSSKIKQNIQWHAKAEIREDIADKNRNRIWIDELWITHKMKNVDITLGKQILGWGTTDGINPVNNVNPVDFSDFLDTDNQRIGVYGIRTQFFWGSFDADLIWMPIASRGKLPATNSRWFPSLSLMGFPQQLKDLCVSVDINYKLPEPRFRNSEFGARLRKRFQGIDLGMSYYNGFEPLPELSFDTLMLQPTPLLILKGNHYRHQVLGAELAIALPLGLSLRAESAYFVQQKKKPNSTNFIQSVVGIDRSFSFNNSSLLTVVQYVNDYQIKGIPYKPIDIQHLFRNSVVTNFDLTFHNGLAAKLVSVINLSSMDFLIRPEVNYTTSKGIKFIVRGDILEGKDDTFFGIYSQNSRIQCKIEYMF